MVQPDPPPEPDPRRTAMLGLLVVAILVAVGWFLILKLRAMSELQDCALQGRSNCAPIE